MVGTARISREGRADGRASRRQVASLPGVHRRRQDLWLGGVFREIVAPERLVFTFAWEEEGERGLETLVTVTFADQNGKTLMTFRQAPFQSDGERDGHRYGWGSSFDRLEDVLRGVSSKTEI
jgi:uncharacterized protein YndB with AHSA1/START domain